MTINLSPYHVGNAVGGTEYFVGREEILDKVVRDLESRETNAVLLHGQRRIGKTSILKELELKKLPSTNYIPIFIDMLGENHDLDSIAQNIYLKIINKLSDNVTIPKIPVVNALALRNLLQKHIPSRLQQPKALVILVDEFDAFIESIVNPRFPQEFYTFFYNLITVEQNIKVNFVFVIGREANLAMDKTPDYFNKLFKGNIHSYKVSTLVPKEAQQIIEFSQSTLNWQEKAKKQVLFYTGCHPLFTQGLCQEIWDRHVPFRGKIPTHIEITTDIVNETVKKVIDRLDMHVMSWLMRSLSGEEKLVAHIFAKHNKPVAQNEVTEVLYRYKLKNIERLADLILAQLIKWDILELLNNVYYFKVELIRLWFAQDQQSFQDGHNLLALQFYEKAKRKYEDGDKDSAIEALNKALSEYDAHIGANQLLADIYLETGKEAEAQKILEEQHFKAPKFFQEQLIKCYEQRLEKAVDNKAKFEFAEKILRLKPSHSKAKSVSQIYWQAAADAAYQKADYIQAAEFYRKAGDFSQFEKADNKIKEQKSIEQQYEQAWQAIKKGDRETAISNFTWLARNESKYRRSASFYQLLLAFNISPLFLRNIFYIFLILILPTFIFYSSWFIEEPVYVNIINNMILYFILPFLGSLAAFIIFLTYYDNHQNSLDSQLSKNLSLLPCLEKNKLYLETIARNVAWGMSSAIIDDKQNCKTILLDYLGSEKNRQPLYGNRANKEIWTFSYLLVSGLEPDCEPITFWQKALKPLLAKNQTNEGLQQKYKVCQENNFDIYELEQLFLHLSALRQVFILLIDDFEGLIERDKMKTSAFLGGLKRLTQSSSASFCLVIATSWTIEQLHEKTNELNKTASGYFNNLSVVTLEGGNVE